MDLLLAEQTNRQQVVRQAVANLQARGITPPPAVLALYERYVRAELSRTQVAVLMQQRAGVLLRAALSTQVEAPPNCRITLVA